MTRTWLLTGLASLAGTAVLAVAFLATADTQAEPNKPAKGNADETRSLVRRAIEERYTLPS